MNRFWTSDTHFGHGHKLGEVNEDGTPKIRGIMKHCPETRSYSCHEEMDEDLIRKWNSVVRTGDMVYHLGDFGFGGYATINYLQTIIDRLNGTKILVVGNHDHRGKRLHGWEKIVKYEELTIKPIRLRMFHYPIESWADMGEGSIHLHGHSHGGMPGNNQRCDVGIDSWNGYPITLEQILERLATLPPPAFLDHHKPKN